jgi:hypothetical protein
MCPFPIRRFFPFLTPKKQPHRSLALPKRQPAGDRKAVDLFAYKRGRSLTAEFLF